MSSTRRLGRNLRWLLSAELAGRVLGFVYLFAAARLLGIEGYNGVKTGTTSAAGCCLVSSGTRDGKSLYVVVLGADTSDARYVDSENLFHWAWRKLED